ncbi:MAG: mobilization protein [Burkholderiaceae bacterium]|nr:mobilization protein [Burkholderiaceae bacterium]
MVIRSIEERLAHLDAQRKTLQARLGKQERAKDTRRKVLLGALVLHQIDNAKDEEAQWLKRWIKREFPGFLTRDADKMLFDDLLKSSAKEPILAKTDALPPGTLST